MDGVLERGLMSIVGDANAESMAACREGGRW
jgi:hypothetical protein